jgi:hypothetical protein
MTMRVPDEGYSRMRRGIKLFILQSLHLLYKYTIRIMFCFIRLVYRLLVAFKRLLTTLTQCHILIDF